VRRVVKALAALLLLAAVFVGGVAWTHRTPKDDAFDPDYNRVFNGFQQSTSELVGGDGVSSVEPDSDCKRVEDTRWRCYRRWAPVGHPEAAEILQADVNVYQDRVVVGTVSRTPDSSGN
jgi:hypothetical protein